jgi:NADPH-dependent ferric siderophore reductase
MNDLSNPIATTGRRPQRVRHEIRRRELHVLRADNLTPHFRRIVLGGADLAGFVSSGFDDHIKLILDDSGEPVMRDYTPRHYDAAKGELTIEFALHGEGPAANWAEHAAPGKILVVAGPKGSLVVPTDYDWHLLIADETGLPAICRRLEELPVTTRAIVFVLTADGADHRLLTANASLEQHWFTAADELLAAVRAFELPAGEGYAWCAGEAHTSRELRRILVDEKGHDRHAIRAAAYWKAGVADHHENLDGA